MVEIREASEEDRKTVLRVLWRAFQPTDSYDDIEKKNWLDYWHRPTEYNWSYVAIDNNRVVSNLSFFVTDDDVIRGAPVMFAGVWGVATEPNYRRTGLVRKLFENSFLKMHEEGAVLSILDPFYRPFYEQFGYALAEKRTRHVFTRQDLKHVRGPPDISSHEAKHSDDTDKAIEVEKSMARFGSRFFLSKRLWEERMMSGNLYILERGGKPVGTIAFSFQKSSTGRGNDIIIGSTRYTDDEVFPAILELVYNYLANVKTATWMLGFEVPLRHFILSHSAESYQIGSMMMRVIDFEKYCNSITIPKHVTEGVTIELKDKMCPWNTGVYSLIPENGHLTAESVDGSADIMLDDYNLSKVISGVSPASMLRAFKEIDCSQKTALKLDSIFPADIFESYHRF